MAARTVISVQGLGKRYELGETVSANTARDALASAVRRLFGRGADEGARRRREFWALRDVSFDVAEGEVVGIIGANGAGKSTLLKILSQITEPTTGEVRIRGRVASLLEVGTGFHQELTGRENVFMNGAILGMSQAEIRRKFDEIVDFAGVEAFIDTPVKRYSSGMLVRLGFAVAAHLEPEILVVDEVLAVGDEEFQRKCLKKMEHVSHSGRTVLFVSHNMAAVESLCTRAILLECGIVRHDGAVRMAIGNYRQRASSTLPPSKVSLVNHSGRPAGRAALMTSVQVLDGEGSLTTSFLPGDSIRFSVHHAAPNRPISPVLGVIIKTSDQAPVLGQDNRTVSGYTFPRTLDSGVITCTVPELPLTPGRYAVDLYFGDSVQSLDLVRDAVAFEVRTADVFGTGRLPPPGCGPVLWKADWTWEPTKPTDCVAAIAKTSVAASRSH